MGKHLIAIARQAIAQVLGEKTAALAHSPLYARPGATFVTLTLDGNLRGCIGTLEAHRPLHEDVKENAISAAFRDPRFDPLTSEEFPAVRIEVSLLSANEPLPHASEADALSQLRPHQDGVVFQLGMRRSTFLPQVWESLPAPSDFLRHLKLKAGIHPDFWSHEVKLYRYTVEKWKEE